ncbi:MAG TPA: tetratricopeptide repeat protein [Geobacteraceae bacterium]|nr:tetratricopeptide repeat protein [Geobacteraceae bacterium]
MIRTEPTPIPGIRYYTPADDAELIARDGKVRTAYGDVPIPLQEDDFAALGGIAPSYDAIGRGIYLALRSNPDCAFGDRYANILKEAYPHFVSELASHLVMLEKKDVDVAYLDRKIRCLKIFALIEPSDPHIPLEIGRGLLERGTTAETFNRATSSLYEAEEFLQRSISISPDSFQARHHLAEVSYLLGRYDNARALWHGVLPALPASESRQVAQRLKHLDEGLVPRVPVVDYLEAIAIAFDCYQREEWEEAAAILHDVLDDENLQSEFPLPEVWYVLGLCCTRLAMPRYAEEYLRKALELSPSYGEARSALKNLYS